MKSKAWVALSLLFAVLGCAGSDDAPPIGADAGVDSGPIGCLANSDCALDPAGPICDTARGACVGCLPDDNPCDPRRHCDPDTLTCVEGCGSDDGCRVGLRCDTASHACVECVEDADCPDGRCDLDAHACVACLEDVDCPDGRCDTETQMCVQCLGDDDCSPGDRCVANECVFGCETSATCAEGQSCCDGGCIDTETSVDHCGACGTACSVADGTPACVGGACAVGDCTAPFADCNGTYDDGCEVDTSVTVDHCGACDAACATPANGTPACVASTCTIESCAAGWSDCNTMIADGCETNLSTTSTCGTCFTACPDRPSATTVCTAAGCGIVCNAGRGDCNANVVDGCEVDLSSTLAHCGACGRTCSIPNATAMCAAGDCAIAACDPGWADCNGDVIDGCEIDIRTSLSHCGGCGMVCSPSGGAGVCTGGACMVSGCDPGYGDCDGSSANGCESSLATDPGNCGACGSSCARPNTVGGCSSSTCVFTGCTTGWVNLDGSWANGCEYACTFTSATDLPDDGFVDANCDGIDGDPTVAIFVSPTGSDANPGTRTSPKRSLSAGITAAAVAGRDVYVAAGTYTSGTLVLADGVSIYGGFSPIDWSRSEANTVTVSHTGAVVSGRIVAIEGAAITTETILDRLTVQTPNAGAAEVSNYGVYCSGCSGLSIRSSTITAGNGGPGIAGGSGPAGGSGTIGINGGGGSCDGSTPGAGGAGGTSACGRSGGAGGRGGSECSCSGYPGSSGVGGTPGGSGGSGGDPGRAGGAGGTGANGTAGPSGAGGSGGMVLGGYWSSTGGQSGAAGIHGNGGGGGGGGGGQGGTFVNDGTGNGGGGGGAGGCGGAGGGAGSGGGGSFGVFLYNSTGATLVNNTIASGNGGNGGAGGGGGSGGSGANGGAGGTVCTGEVGAGGNGGRGGDGGSGGHGGGGAGGPSYAVYRAASTVSTAGNMLSAGAGGAGGSSPGSAGAPGASGLVY